MSTRTPTRRSRTRKSLHAEFERAVALLTSPSGRRVGEGAERLLELARTGHVEAIAYMADWCRDVGKLERAEAWAARALAAGDHVPLVQLAYEWIYGKDGWDRSARRAPPTRGRDPRRGLRMLVGAARRGSVGATSSLASLYEDGGSFATDDRRALAWTRRGAALGDTDSITNLGRRYFYGHGVRIDKARAVALYRRSAAIGCPHAAYNMGLVYEHGDGVRKNARLAVSWMRRAAERGNSSGWLRLADYSFDGRGVPRSPARGLACLRRAQRDTWRADRELARRKLWGDGLRLDVKGGLSILRARMRCDDAEAMVILADWYHDVREDHARAIGLYRQAARLGNGDAMCSLHDCLSAGHPPLVRDQRTALRWLRRALGLEDDGAYYRMGERLVTGNGVPRDASRGVQLIRRSMAAHIGNAWQSMGEYLLARARGRKEIRTARDHFLEAKRLGVDTVEAELLECRRRLRSLARGSRAHGA